MCLESKSAVRLSVLFGPGDCHRRGLKMEELCMYYTLCTFDFHLILLALRKYPDWTIRIYMAIFEAAFASFHDLILCCLSYVTLTNPRLLQDFGRTAS